MSRKPKESVDEVLLKARVAFEQACLWAKAVERGEADASARSHRWKRDACKLLSRAKSTAKRRAPTAPRRAP